MATARAISKPTYELEITHDEAVALFALYYSSVSGSAEGPRGLVSNIAAALDAAAGGLVDEAHTRVHVEGAVRINYHN